MNKILINAARYLDAMHDIRVDENDPRLDTIIRQHVLKLETPELINYWKAYLADIDIENANTEIRESVAEVAKVEKAIYYRGVKIEQKTSEGNSPQEANKQVLYRGAQQAEGDTNDGSPKGNKPKPVYRGVKSK